MDILTSPDGDVLRTPRKYILTKYPSSALLALCEGNPSTSDCFRWQRFNHAESVSMPCCHYANNQNGHEFQLCTMAITFKTHWGQVTHICVSKLTVIGSYNGLSPGRRQAIVWTNAGMLLIGTLGINFSETLIAIYPISFRKMYLKLSSGKWRPLCLGLNVLSNMVSDV